MSQETPKTKHLILTFSHTVAKAIESEILHGRMNEAGLDLRSFDLGGARGAFVGRCGVVDDHGAMLLPQPAHGVIPIDLHGLDQANDPFRDRGLERDALEAILETGAEYVLVNVPPDAAPELQKMEDAWDFSWRTMIAESAYALTLVISASYFLKSLANIKIITDLYAALEPRIVVVLDEAGHKERDPQNLVFVNWDGDADECIPEHPIKRLIDGLGRTQAGVVKLPALYGKTSELCETYRTRFNSDPLDPRYSNENVRRINKWRRSVVEAMAPIDHLLGIPVPKAQPSSIVFETQLADFKDWLWNTYTGGDRPRGADGKLLVPQTDNEMLDFVEQAHSLYVRFHAATPLSPLTVRNPDLRAKELLAFVQRLRNVEIISTPTVETYLAVPPNPKAPTTAPVMVAKAQAQAPVPTTPDAIDPDFAGGAGAGMKIGGGPQARGHRDGRVRTRVPSAGPGTAASDGDDDGRRSWPLSRGRRPSRRRLHLTQLNL